MIGRSNLSYFTLLKAEMETSKDGSSKLIVMTVLEPKDELSVIYVNVIFRPHERTIIRTVGYFPSTD